MFLIGPFSQKYRITFFDQKFNYNEKWKIFRKIEYRGKFSCNINIRRVKLGDVYLYWDKFLFFSNSSSSVPPFDVICWTRSGDCKRHARDLSMRLIIRDALVLLLTQSSCKRSQNYQNPTRSVVLDLSYDA